jgi:hypothetical protein
MKLSQAIAIVSFAGISWIAAQNTVPQPERDSLFESANKILLGQPDKPNEVTVVLPPPDSEPPAAAEAAGKPAENTGEPPADEDATPPEPEAETVADEQENKAAAITAEPPEEAPQDPQPGLAVRIERLQSGSGGIDPAQVKLLAPFPAKLLARSPQGWRIEASEQAPPFTREVELSPGKNITLTIRPHLLVPQADGSNVFQVAEPGYDAPLGYLQDATVGAILSNSIRQLENDSLQLAAAIENLQQLLVSLPQPEPAPGPAPSSQPANQPKR